MADLSKRDDSSETNSDKLKNGSLRNLNDPQKINPFINNVLNDLTLSQKIQVIKKIKKIHF